MEQITIKNGEFEGFPIERVRKFLQGSSTCLKHARIKKIIRKHGDIVFIYFPNNRRIGPRGYDLHELESEINLTLLLEHL